VTALHRKLLRDLWHLRGQVAAIALVVICGVATVVTTRTAYESLVVSQALYYAEYRFADVFASLKRAPEALVPRISALPGVEAAHTRVVFEVTLDVEGLDEPATGRLVSIPEREAPILNDIHIRRGRRVEPGRRDEILISESFAEANGLEVGDTIAAILNGRWERLRIVGVAISPEYIYEIRGPEVFPDPQRFGVLWMGRDAMAPAFDMDGAFNDVALRLAANANEEEVIAQLDHLLERYGGLGAYGRLDNVSHRFISDEIAQNRVTGTVMPTIFLGVAAFLLNIVLSRVVSTQRDQIAVLKAFGYRSRTIGLHYLQFGLVAVIAGAVPGTALGLWLGARLNELYVEVYRFPIFRYEPGFSVFALALGVSIVSALVGALGAVRRALALPPAEAMRPESPARFHAGWLERLKLRARLPVPARIILRNLSRRPTRALLSTVGIACAVAILIVGRFFVDSVRHIADVQFRIVERADATVSFHEPQPGSARFEVARLPGVLGAEPYRAVPARLRFEHRSRRIALVGLPAGAELRRPVDRDLVPVAIPESGVVLTKRLAEILGARPGSLLTVEVLEGQRPVREVAVAALVDELIGLSAYMDLRELNRLMREGRTTSGALLAVDSRAENRLYARLKRIPAVSGVTIREAALASFEETLARSIGIITTVLIAFSCAISVATVYNAARIALSERARELASLRVLGFTRREIAVMLLGEHALLTLAAIPLGYAIGYQICALVARAYQWELFRLPLVVSRETYGFALVVVLASAFLSALIVRRRLDRLDLVAVLKTRE
jgi:putative ABC transport system permease protein